MIHSPVPTHESTSSDVAFECSLESLQLNAVSLSIRLGITATIRLPNDLHASEIGQRGQCNKEGRQENNYLNSKHRIERFRGCVQFEVKRLDRPRVQLLTSLVHVLMPTIEFTNEAAPNCGHPLPFQKVSEQLQSSANQPDKVHELNEGAHRDEERHNAHQKAVIVKGYKVLDVHNAVGVLKDPDCQRIQTEPIDWNSERTIKFKRIPFLKSPLTHLPELP